MIFLPKHLLDQLLSFEVPPPLPCAGKTLGELTESQLGAIITSPQCDRDFREIVKNRLLFGPDPKPSPSRPSKDQIEAESEVALQMFRIAGNKGLTTTDLGRHLGVSPAVAEVRRRVLEKQGFVRKTKKFRNRGPVWAITRAGWMCNFSNVQH